MRDVTQLHPELQHKVWQLQKMCEAQGLPLGIGECLRTVEEQDALYAQGRTKLGPIVTYAKGSSYSSQHQWGIAFDFYKDVKGDAYDESGTGFFPKVGALAKSIGLGWGGDWISPVDQPHLYLPQWGDTPAPLKRQYTIPSNFFKTWHVDAKPCQLEVDGWMGPATVQRLQEIFGTPEDGVISDQWVWYRDENPGLIAVEWVQNPQYGSLLVKQLQRYAGAHIDGVIGPETIAALQRKFGTPIDGYVSGPSALIMAIQDWANKQ